MSPPHRDTWRALSLALVLCLPAADSGADGEAPTEKPSRSGEAPMSETTVFDFESHEDPWPNIDDPVMGGLSRSRMTIDEGIGVFEGVVSLENNGGFASLRSRPAEHDLRGFEGLVLRVLGDGKTYGVRLRTDATFDGVNYQAKLATEAGLWTEARVPFETFRPVYRGRVVRGHPALDSGAIKTFGIIISDKQDGPFRLEIDWIKAYRSSHSDM